MSGTRRAVVPIASLLRQLADALSAATIAHLTADLAKAKEQLDIQKRATRRQAELTAHWRHIALTRAPKGTTK